MMNYNNSDVVQCLRQYEMFANSLKLIKTPEEKEMIIRQLTKLENKILTLTNELYEEEYHDLMNQECALLADEKNRITKLIDLINERLSYVEQRCNNHYQLTGSSIDVQEVMGVDDLDDLELRLRIIEKYTKNIKLKQELEEDIQSLNNKITLASEKMTINKSLNIELENALNKALSNAFNNLKIYDLLDIKEDIKNAYDETEGLLNIARNNLELAKINHPELIDECEKMLNDITIDYINYKDKISTIQLIEIYNDKANEYEELLNKRKMLNEIISNIKNSELLGLIADTINKQYNTILMEQQDINTYNDLTLEKDRKEKMLSEIEIENNSNEFQEVLSVLIENERKQQEKIRDEQRRIEMEEKKRRQEIERKKQEEILKRQKIIEEARKKEMEKRTKEMLAEQQNSVLQTKKQSEKVSFETIKDDIADTDTNDDKEPISIKNKQEIENEIFEELRNKENNNYEVSDDIFEKIDEKMNDSKFPDMSLDEYMKNFDENNIENTNSLFEEDDFPSIPL